MFQQHGQNQLGSFLQIVTSLKTSQNPMEDFTAMAKTNPQLGQVLDFVNQNGGNPEKAFYLLTKKMGIDPSMILKMINK